MSACHKGRKVQFPPNHQVCRSSHLVIDEDFVLLESVDSKGYHLPKQLLLFSYEKNLTLFSHRCNFSPVDYSLVKFDQQIAICLLETRERIHIVGLHGHVFVIPLTSPCDKIFRCSYGLGILSRIAKKSSISFIKHPLTPICDIKFGMESLEEFDIIGISLQNQADLLCIYNEKAREVSLFSLTEENIDLGIRSEYHVAPNMTGVSSLEDIEMVSEGHRVPFQKQITSKRLFRPNNLSDNRFSIDQIPKPNDMLKYLLDVKSSQLRKIINDNPNRRMSSPSAFSSNSSFRSIKDFELPHRLVLGNPTGILSSDSKCHICLRFLAVFESYPDSVVQYTRFSNSLEPDYLYLDILANETFDRYKLQKYSKHSSIQKCFSIETVTSADVSKFSLSKKSKPLEVTALCLSNNQIIELLESSIISTSKLPNTRFASHLKYNAIHSTTINNCEVALPCMDSLKKFKLMKSLISQLLNSNVGVRCAKVYIIIICRLLAQGRSETDIITVLLSDFDEVLSRTDCAKDLEISDLHQQDKDNVSLLIKNFANNKSLLIGHSLQYQEFENLKRYFAEEKQCEDSLERICSLFLSCLRIEGNCSELLSRFPLTIQSLIEKALASIDFAMLNSMSIENSMDLLHWINRKDYVQRIHQSISEYIQKTSIHSDDLQEIEKLSSLRFTEDDRMKEVSRILRSSRPIYLKLEKSPDNDDLEYRKRLQMKLLILCRRTLAYSVGRGMLTMGTIEPLVAEALSCSPIVLAGRVAPTNSLIAFDSSSAPSELTLWPEFHNGVANGLKIENSGKNNIISRSWIMYNKTNAQLSGIESTHAGVLLALGLRSHLNLLTLTDICDYLTQGHDPTTTAILIGISASKMGSMDSVLSKTLCLHIPSLLQSKHSEIEIAPTVQTAAFVGLGLLYYGSGHRLMVEFLLTDLSRISLSDKGDHREALGLSAAWALGMILLGKGAQSKALDVEDRLQVLIDGGKREDSKIFSSTSISNYRIYEPHEEVNTSVTTICGIIALSLIYLQSNDQSIALRISVPQDEFSLESMRPDILYYRSLASCLIMSSSTKVSEEWFASSIPKVLFPSIRSFVTSKGVPFEFPFIQANLLELNSKYLKKGRMSSYSAICSYLSIVSGLCMGSSLLQAGSSDLQLLSILMKFLRFLQKMRDAKLAHFANIGHTDVKILRSFVEMCVTQCSLACSIVMVGTGNIELFKLLRELRWKTEDITYGSHQALSMSIGMLFLAGGRASFRCDNLAIAALLISVIPRFPIRTTDNQYHLQALRHLYVLAVEYRLLDSFCVDKQKNISVNIEIEMKDGQVIHAKTPCMLPDLSSACMVPSLVLKERDDVLRSSNVNLYQLRMSEFKHKLSFEINN